MNKLFCVKKRYLLLIASIVWIIAGLNVLRLGVMAYGEVEAERYFYLLTYMVFIAFGAMFYRMTVKHTRRIVRYEEYKQFWYFFDIKAYIIMAIMMGGGIGLRVAGVLPDVFVAIFYSGLGSALTLAGVIFFINFIGYRRAVIEFG